MTLWGLSQESIAVDGIRKIQKKNATTRYRRSQETLRRIAEFFHIGYKGNMSGGVIEVDLFPEDVNSADHPEARKFKKLLKDVAKEYGCKLTSFEVEHGTVSFSFDSDVLLAEILRILESKSEGDAG
jgi:hypothetical protein